MLNMIDYLNKIKNEKYGKGFLFILFSSVATLVYLTLRLFGVFD